jgi:hypothetical protein
MHIICPLFCKGDEHGQLLARQTLSYGCKCLERKCKRESKVSESSGCHVIIQVISPTGNNKKIPMDIDGKMFWKAGIWKTENKMEG